MKNKLSEELKHCLDGKGCFKCAYSDEKAIMSCRNLLQNAYEKIKYFDDLEEQGLLLKLPCKVGDTVYVIRLDNEAYMRNEYKWEIIKSRFEIRHYENFDKTVFLTPDEAEEALKRMEKERKR